ncbi:hypothetical protein Nmel_003422 [Mimus melanotis]
MRQTLPTAHGEAPRDAPGWKHSTELGWSPRAAGSWHRPVPSPRLRSSAVSSSLCKLESLQLVRGGGARLLSLGFAVKLFKTNLDVATLSPITL